MHTVKSHQLGINVTWNASSGATSYILERSLNGSSGWGQVYSGSSTSFSNTGLTAGTTYYYRVLASNTGGNSAYSSTSSATTRPNAPATPTGLAASAASQTQINVSWNASSGATSYILERSVNGSSGWGQVYSGSATSFQNTGLTAGTTYYYRVLASNTGGNSAYSSNASTTTLPNAPAAPTGLNATAASQTQINLSWNASSGATSYILEQSVNGSTGWGQVYSGPATSYSNTGLTANTTYYYRIKASNSGGTSAYTSNSSTTTLPNAPATPTGLSATAASQTQINVGWSSVSGATNYVLERSPDGTNNWVQVYSGSATSYQNTGLTMGTTYYYRVRASNTGGSSSYSSTAAATTTDTDIGDTLATASNVVFSNNSYSITEKIGNGPNGTKDVDMYKITVDSADIRKAFTFRTALPSGSGFSSVDTYIRLFNSSGTQIDYNDDGGGSNYSLLTFTPTSAGTYYLGVSSYGNRTYTPSTAASGPGGTTGDYTHTVSGLYTESSSFSGKITESGSSDENYRYSIDGAINSSAQWNITENGTRTTNSRNEWTDKGSGTVLKTYESLDVMIGSGNLSFSWDTYSGTQKVDSDGNDTAYQTVVYTNEYLGGLLVGGSTNVRGNSKSKSKSDADGKYSVDFGRYEIGIPEYTERYTGKGTWTDNSNYSYDDDYKYAMSYSGGGWNLTSGTAKTVVEDKSDFKDDCHGRYYEQTVYSNDFVDTIEGSWGEGVSEHYDSTRNLKSHVAGGTWHDEGTEKFKERGRGYTDKTIDNGEYSRTVEGNTLEGKLGEYVRQEYAYDFKGTLELQDGETWVLVDGEGFNQTNEGSGNCYDGGVTYTITGSSGSGNSAQSWDIDAEIVEWGRFGSGQGIREEYSVSDGDWQRDLIKATLVNTEEIWFEDTSSGTYTNGVISGNVDRRDSLYNYIWLAEIWLADDQESLEGEARETTHTKMENELNGEGQTTVDYAGSGWTVGPFRIAGTQSEEEKGRFDSLREITFSLIEDDVEPGEDQTWSWKYDEGTLEETSKFDKWTAFEGNGNTLVSGGTKPTNVDTHSAEYAWKNGYKSETLEKRELSDDNDLMWRAGGTREDRWKQTEGKLETTYSDELENKIEIGGTTKYMDGSTTLNGRFSSEDVYKFNRELVLTDTFDADNGNLWRLTGTGTGQELIDNTYSASGQGSYSTNTTSSTPVLLDELLAWSQGWNHFDLDRYETDIDNPTTENSTQNSDTAPPERHVCEFHPDTSTTLATRSRPGLLLNRDELKLIDGNRFEEYLVLEEDGSMSIMATGSLSGSASFSYSTDYETDRTLKFQKSETTRSATAKTTTTDYQPTFSPTMTSFSTSGWQAEGTGNGIIGESWDFRKEASGSWSGSAYGAPGNGTQTESKKDTWDYRFDFKESKPLSASGNTWVYDSVSGGGSGDYKYENKITVSNCPYSISMENGFATLTGSTGYSKNKTETNSYGIGGEILTGRIEFSNSGTATFETEEDFNYFGGVTKVAPSTGGTRTFTASENGSLSKTEVKELAWQYRNRKYEGEATTKSNVSGNGTYTYFNESIGMDGQAYLMTSQTETISLSNSLVKEKKFENETQWSSLLSDQWDRYRQSGGASGNGSLSHTHCCTPQAGSACLFYNTTYDYTASWNESFDRIGATYHLNGHIENNQMQSTGCGTGSPSVQYKTVNTPGFWSQLYPVVPPVNYQGLRPVFFDGTMNRLSIDTAPSGCIGGGPSGGCQFFGSSVFPLGASSGSSNVSAEMATISFPHFVATPSDDANRPTKLYHAANTVPVQITCIGSGNPSQYFSVAKEVTASLKPFTLPTATPGKTKTSGNGHYVTPLEIHETVFENYGRWREHETLNEDLEEVIDWLMELQNEIAPYIPSLLTSIREHEYDAILPDKMNNDHYEICIDNDKIESRQLSTQQAKTNGDSDEGYYDHNNNWISYESVWGKIATTGIFKTDYETLAAFRTLYPDKESTLVSLANQGWQIAPAGIWGKFTLLTSEKVLNYASKTSFGYEMTPEEKAKRLYEAVCDYEEKTWIKPYRYTSNVDNTLSRAFENGLTSRDGLKHGNKDIKNDIMYTNIVAGYINNLADLGEEAIFELATAGPMLTGAGIVGKFAVKKVGWAGQKLVLEKAGSVVWEASKETLDAICSALKRSGKSQTAGHIIEYATAICDNLMQSFRTVERYFPNAVPVKAAKELTHRFAPNGCMSSCFQMIRQHLGVATPKELGELQRLLDAAGGKGNLKNLFNGSFINQFNNITKNVTAKIAVMDKRMTPERALEMLDAFLDSTKNPVMIGFEFKVNDVKKGHAVLVEKIEGNWLYVWDPNYDLQLKIPFSDLAKYWKDAFYQTIIFQKLSVK